VDGYNYPPFSVKDIEGKKIAQVKKLQILYPQYSTDELQEIMHGAGWDWHLGLEELKARRVAAKKRKQELNKAQEGQAAK
jgi:hypothetical protein